MYLNAFFLLEPDAKIFRFGRADVGSNSS